MAKIFALLTAFTISLSDISGFENVLRFSVFPVYFHFVSNTSEFFTFSSDVSFLYTFSLIFRDFFYFPDTPGLYKI